MERHGRGYGFFIWKPVVILEALAGLGPSDILVYSDIGSTWQVAGRERFREYLEICRQSPWGMLSFANTHTENLWTKADLAVRLNVLDDYNVMATTQLSAGLIVLRNDSSNRDLVQEWADIAIEEAYHYSDNSPSSTQNHPEFHEHRWDQSIYSLLAKMRGASVTHYAAQSYEWAWEEYADRVPVRATRLRS